MSRIDGLSAEVVGLVLIGAEGCSEVANEEWLRDATSEERQLFINHCRELVRNNKGDKAANAFDFANYTVDGTGRPYWLKAVLDLPSTPTVAREKAARFTRVLRVNSD